MYAIGPRSLWNFFCRWLQTFEEYCESFRTQNLSKLEIRNKNVTQLFFYVLCVLKASVQTLLKENCKFVSQTLHYSNEFNNFVVCHHIWSFHVTLSLFLFKNPHPPPPPHDVLQMCHNPFRKSETKMQPITELADKEGNYVNKFSTCMY